METVITSEGNKFVYFVLQLQETFAQAMIFVRPAYVQFDSKYANF